MIREKEYLELINERPESFKQNDILKIILDKGEIEDFESNNPGKQIGILYKSNFNMMVVDLVEDINGNRFCYERVMHTNPSLSCVIIPKIKDNFILVNQYRHAVRDYRYAFPRGFGEVNLDAVKNSIKELTEEIGGNVIQSKSIGKIEPDNGLTDTNVNVMVCELDTYDSASKEEGIIDILLLSESELNKMIINGKIVDAMTLSAYMLYCSCYQ